MRMMFGFDALTTGGLLAAANIPDIQKLAIASKRNLVSIRLDFINSCYLQTLTDLMSLEAAGPSVLRPWLT